MDAHAFGGPPANPLHAPGVTFDDADLAYVAGTMHQTFAQMQGGFAGTRGLLALALSNLEVAAARTTKLYAANATVRCAQIATLLDGPGSPRARDWLDRACAFGDLLGDEDRVTAGRLDPIVRAAPLDSDESMLLRLFVSERGTAVVVTGSYVQDELGYARDAADRSLHHLEGRGLIATCAPPRAAGFTVTDAGRQALDARRAVIEAGMTFTGSTAPPGRGL